MHVRVIHDDGTATLGARTCVVSATCDSGVLHVCNVCHMCKRAGVQAREREKTCSCACLKEDDGCRCATLGVPVIDHGARDILSLHFRQTGRLMIRDVRLEDGTGECKREGWRGIHSTSEAKDRDGQDASKRGRWQ
jgi:hypothetical protein